MPIKDPVKLKAARARADAKRRGRTRYFGTVVYPDSAPKDWQTILRDTHLQAFISPLHDKDVNPDGTKKKAHWHVMVIYDSVKNFEKDVQPLFKAIGGVGREVIASPRGYARYLCHLDNPEKHQYMTSDVIALGGIVYDDVIHTDADDCKVINEICTWCRSNKIYSMAQLMDYAYTARPDWYQLIALHRAYVIGRYLQSLVWEVEHSYDDDTTKEKSSTSTTSTVRIDKQGKIIDAVTGEILGYTANNE